jgi:DNA-binding transcriptional MerR regulator
MAWTVSQLAKLAGVSVRTLHHYDELGLLRPSDRSDAGYRLYSRRDLERLQQILFFRVLEFPLPEIARIMSDPGFDVREALRLQRQLLTEKAVRVNALIDAVDAALARIEAGIEGETVMKVEDSSQMFSAFKDFNQAEYEDEVKERWGDTEAYRESKRRTAKYGKKEWEAIKAEGEAVFATLARLMAAGTPATDAAAMDAAEAHRQHVERWFYPCSRQMHRGLGELYVNDPRFTANLDKIRPGLAAYAKEAFRANADR